MPKTGKNRGKRPRLLATKAGRKKARSGPSKELSAAIPNQTIEQAKVQIANELKRTVPYLAGGVIARPADFPIGSMQSRAAARAMSANRIELDPSRAILSSYTRDPMPHEIVVPSAPACGPGCGCQECRVRFWQDSRPEKPLQTASVQASERVPDIYVDAARRENVLRAFQDVARAGGHNTPPTPAWASRL